MYWLRGLRGVCWSLGRLGRLDLLVERGLGRGRGRGLLLGLPLLDQLLDVGVDARQGRLVLAASALAWLCAEARLSRVAWACDFCCSRVAWLAANWACAVCRRSIVEVTLPVAIDEYSDRMPLVLTFDVKIWVAVLDVPEFV